MPTLPFEASSDHPALHSSPTRRSSDLNGAKIFVRINAGEPALDDAAAACRAGAFGLFVPKVRAPADLERIDAHLTRIEDRKSTRLNSSHMSISYAVFCLKKKNRSY